MQAMAATLRSRTIPMRVEPAASILIGPTERITIVPMVPIIVRPTPALLVLPVQRLLVRPPARPLWDERGWIRHGGRNRCRYEGAYVARTRQGRVVPFVGRIEQDGNDVRALVADPPSGLRGHPKAACFHLVGAGPWFSVNWHRPASEPDAAIAYIEQVLTEALARQES
jgi:hypothetical protein